MVRSGSRNARAISAVLMPARLRRVSATWASRFSDGWQQVNMSSRRSSGISLSRAYGGGSGCMAATSRSFAASVNARRIRSMARCRAVVVSHASGSSGTPDSGHFWSACAKASWAHSSARSQSPRVSRIMVATIRLHPSA